MTETLHAPVEINSAIQEKEWSGAAHEMRAQAQSVLRRVRPENAPRRELISTRPKDAGNGVKVSLEEDWQSPEIVEDAPLHDKRLHLVTFSVVDEAGVTQEVRETLATFHSLQGIGIDGETGGYKPLTLSEGVTYARVEDMLAVFENGEPTKLAGRRDLGRSAVQGVQQ